MSVWLSVPQGFTVPIVTLNVPLTCGVPEMTPVVLPTASPFGRPVAVNAEGLLLAVMV